MYFFCDVFFPGQANLLEILSEECLLIKCWVVIIQIVFMVVLIMINVLDSMDSVDSVSLWFQHL